METIEHDGIIQSSGSDHVTVRITSASACSGCQGEGSCSLSGKKEKLVDIAGSYQVNPGDRVKVLMKQSDGYAALLLGYVIPLILVVTSLVVLISLDVPELPAGLFSLAILAPWYGILRLLRHRIEKKINFSIKY
ncbi:MAG: SoxR reducing system RseC family protein [Bacteroidales bacterium]|nr:SoxR reducing system RseC family protein [Bacteroidales bacterium]